MIEKIIFDYLNDVLQVNAYMESPPEPPEKYVVIQKTGSGKMNQISNAMVVLQSYAGSLYEAAELNEAVKEAMDNIVALDDVCKAKLNSDYNYTDTAKKGYRYQAVFDITHY